MSRKIQLISTTKGEYSYEMIWADLDRIDYVRRRDGITYVGIRGVELPVSYTPAEIIRMINPVEGTAP